MNRCIPRSFASLLILVAGVPLFVAACASDRAADGESSADSLTSGPCIDIHVDANATVGSDERSYGGCGSSARNEPNGEGPCRTVTRALRGLELSPRCYIVHVVGQRLQSAGGLTTFNASSTEAYPIHVPSNVIIDGRDGANGGGYHGTCFQPPSGVDAFVVDRPSAVYGTTWAKLQNLSIGECSAKAPRAKTGIVASKQVELWFVDVRHVTAGIRLDGGVVTGGNFPIDDVSDGVVCRSDTNPGSVSSIGQVNVSRATHAGLVASRSCVAAGSLSVTDSEYGIIAESNAVVSMSSMQLARIGIDGIHLRKASFAPSGSPTVSLKYGTIEHCNRAGVYATAGSVYRSSETSIVTLEDNTCDAVATSGARIDLGPSVSVEPTCH